MGKIRERLEEFTKAMTRLPITGSNNTSPSPIIRDYPMSFQGWPDRIAERSGVARQGSAPVGQAVSNPWVYSDIAAIAKEFSTADLEIYTTPARTKRSTARLHPFEKLWKKPNPFMSRAFLMQEWIWQLQLFGEAYLFIARDTSRPDRIAEIWPIPSSLIKPVGHAQEYISHYEYRRTVDKNSVVVKIDPTYICYTRLPGPFDMLRGQSPLVALGLSIDTDRAQSEWNHNFFNKENGVPSAIITLAQETSESDFLRAKSELTEFYGGTRRRSLITRSGDVDVKLLTYAHRDMDFIAGREVTQREIDRVFGIPEGFWSKDATRSNSEGARATMIENAVHPLHILLAEDLTTQVLDEWYTPDTLAEFSDIRFKNIDLEMRQMRANQGIKSLNEIRTDMGLEPLQVPDRALQDLYEQVPTRIALQVLPWISYLKNPPVDPATGEAMPRDEVNTPGTPTHPQVPLSNNQVQGVPTGGTPTTTKKISESHNPNNKIKTPPETPEAAAAASASALKRAELTESLMMVLEELAHLDNDPYPDNDK